MLSLLSLTRRIVFLNVAGLLALVIGILYLSQFRAGLIDARVQSLLVQGEIIAGAIAASATVRAGHHHHRSRAAARPAGRRELRPVRGVALRLEFPINPERVAPVLRRLVSPTKTRARIYDRDGVLILDSRNLYDVLRLRPAAADGQARLSSSALCRDPHLAQPRRPAALSRARAAERQGLRGGRQALPGFKSSMVRINERGEVIVSVAVPVQRFRAVRGALMLSTQGDDIDHMVAAERLGDRQGVPGRRRRDGGAVLLLAGTIAGPVRRLAEGAERVRRRIRSRVEIPISPAAATRSAICPARCAT